MAVETPVPVEKVDAAIDMIISMVVEDLAGELHQSLEETLTQFLQSRTCEILYDRDSKLWWDGPAEIENLYLQEIGKENN